MKILNKSLIKNLGVYTFLNLLNALIPFLLLPVLTKYLSTYDYGVVDVFINLNFILLPILGLNIGSSVLRFYFSDNFDFKKMIHVIISYVLFFGAISLFIIYLFYISGVDFFNGSMPKNILFFTFVYVFFSQIIEILLSVWRAEEQPVNYGVLRISKTALDLGLSLYFVVSLNFGWEGRVYPILITATLLGVISLIILRNKFDIKFDFNKEMINKVLVYSLPLIFHSLGGYLISFSDRFLILYYMDIESVGIYSVAYQIGMVMSFLNNSFNQAYVPFLFSKLKKTNLQLIRKLKKVNNLYFLFMFFLALVIYFFVPFIYDFFIDKKFHTSTEIVFWVLLGYAFNGMYKILVNFLFFFKKTKNIAYITLFSALINIFFCVILIPRIGVLGASISTTIAFATMFLLVLVQYKKLKLDEEKN